MFVSLACMFIQALLLQPLLQNAQECDTWAINLVPGGVDGETCTAASWTECYINNNYIAGRLSASALFIFLVGVRKQK